MPSFQVARPQSTPLNFTPDSPASSSVSLNSALLTPAERFCALDKLHVHGHFHFEYVDAIARFAELAHAFGDDMRFLLRVVESLLVGSFFVADKFEEERNVVGPTLVANALDPGMLSLVHVLGIVRRVVEQNLDA